MRVDKFVVIVIEFHYTSFKWIILCIFCPLRLYYTFFHKMDSLNGRVPENFFLPTDLLYSQLLFIDTAKNYRGS